MHKTNIPWATHAWNPLRGCSKTPCSSGCLNCWSRRMAWRMANNPTVAEKYKGLVTAEGWTGRTRMDGSEWRSRLPKKPARIFVNSMGDTFYDEHSQALVQTLYESFSMHKQHTFIICTKRPERIVPVLYDSGFYGGGDHLPNVWHLTSVENQQMAEKRIPHLIGLQDAGGWPVIGLSVEPMLGPVDISKWAGRLSWCIVGPETGPGRRPFDFAWAKALYGQCKVNGIAFFWKGDDGALPREYPEP